MTETSLALRFNQYIKEDFARHQYYYGVNNKSHFACSLDNDWVPYHALMTGDLITGTNGQKVLAWELDSAPSPANQTGERYRTVKIVEKFIDKFKGGIGWYELRRLNIERRYHCRYGSLVEHTDEGVVTPLVVLALNTRYLFTFNKGNPDYSQFAVIVSSNLMYLASHRTIWNSIEKNIIPEVLQKGMNVITVKDVVNTCYKSPIITIPKFNTIMERARHLEAVTNVKY